eukprot:89466_1
MTSLRTARRNRDLKGVAFSVKMDMIDTVVDYKYINKIVTISSPLQYYELKYQEEFQYQGKSDKTERFNADVARFKRDLLHSFNSRTTQSPYTKHIEMIFKNKIKKKFKTLFNKKK